MSEHIPADIDPFVSSDKQRRYQGSVPQSRFERILGILTDLNHSVWVDLQFGREDRRAVVKGRISATLHMTCQRCLNPLVLQVDERVSLAAVRSLDEAELLPSDLEPFLVPASDKVSLLELIEDELLLAIPLIPRHGHCEPFELEGSQQPEVSVDSRESPFTVLTQLKPNT